MGEGSSCFFQQPFAFTVFFFPLLPFLFFFTAEVAVVGIMGYCQFSYYRKFSEITRICFPKLYVQLSVEFTIFFPVTYFDKFIHVFLSGSPIFFFFFFQVKCIFRIQYEEVFYIQKPSEEDRLRFFKGLILDEAAMPPPRRKQAGKLSYSKNNYRVI